MYVAKNGFYILRISKKEIKKESKKEDVANYIACKALNIYTLAVYYD